MRILRVDTDDAAALAACLAVQEVARQAEDPFGPPKTARALRVFLAEGFEASPCESWYTADGFYWLELPDQENLHLATLLLVTRPDPVLVTRPAACEPAAWAVREELFRHALDRARAHGRTLISIITQQGTATDEFFRALGAKPTILEARRVLDLETGNADSNEHMIAVNETLGFQPLEPFWQWFELPVGEAE